ncbi:MAG: lysine--tRNA ligase [Spirochaetales bacterium]|jgi:lysyl-tRNA synthetase class 1|nr:lysine--tRNA ligase [Spirochaetales bacterium]
MENKSVHWADITAEKIIREKGAKEQYTCASGITPSGTIHIGNFREIISVELIVRALRDQGKNVRFIYSWDNYDVFRKVPKNMPKQEELATYLRKPIIMVPDPWGKEESYARANERAVEEVLPIVGINPEYIYQADKYRVSEYAQGIRTALEKREVIRSILDEHRTSPLADDWWPVSVFCSACNLDETKVTGWDGEWKVTYACSACGIEETVDLRESAVVKLPWRIDWPMRWKHEGVDFEPAGKEHHSAGGSFDTAKQIMAAVYGGQAPVTFKYDFIRIKGGGGKISSSTGEVISLSQVLEIYQPEIVRYLFAGTRPNSEFAISFDLDVLKIYEDYDRAERVYFGKETISARRADKEKRTYEFSQVHSVPEEIPFQVPLRHLTTILQIHSGDIERTLKALEVPEEDKARIRVRANCAWAWLRKYAPEDFRFSLNFTGEGAGKLDDAGKKVVTLLIEEVNRLEKHDEKSLAESLYDIAGKAQIDPKELFKLVYQVLIGKDKGPRLASFIYTVGKEKIVSILNSVV